MNIYEEKKGAVMVVKPSGPLTEADAEAFQQRLMQVRKDRLGRFVVDMTSVPYVDSRGLEALVELSEEVSRMGQSLKLCGVNETLREVLDVTDLTGLFEAYLDAGSAVRSFL